MSKIYVKIVNNKGITLAEKQGNNEVNLVYCNEYQEGDSIIVDVEELPEFYYMQLDDAKGSSLVYLAGVVQYVIPFGEKRRIGFCSTQCD